MRLRGIGWMAALGLLAACSPDYSAVRDWSVQARDALLPLDAQRVRPGSTALPVPPAVVTAGGREGAVQAMQEGAAAWLSFLAYMADDGLPRERTNPLASLIPKAEPFDPEGAAALTNLGETMAFAARRNWRAPYLAYAVDQGDPYFKALLLALRRQVDALAAERVPDYADPSDAARQQAMQQARHYVLDRIAEGYTLMTSRTGHLAHSETARRLRAQEAELRRLMLLRVAG
jgi:hypothetical protein